MPSLQVVQNLRGPKPPEEPNVAQANMERFFTTMGERYREDRDKVQLDALLSQYQKNRDNEHAFEDLQLGIERSDISPSKRLEVQNQLNLQRKANIEEGKAVQQKLKENQKLQDEKKDDQRNIEYLQKAGATEEQIALYNAAPVGGKTKVVGDIIDELKRIKAPPGIVPQGIEDFDKGLTPQERVKRQDDRYKIQTPLVMKNNQDLSTLESEDRSLALLDELDKSGKVGQGVAKLNINPKTGDLIIPEFASAEEQLFVKTVNDFTVKAKDSFGARVTNFELDRFMQRLPTLANSKEGRELIIRQMRIINQINQLEKKGIQEVFDEYGVRNIDYADAETKARKKITEEKDRLTKEYVEYEKVAKKQESEIIANYKSHAKPGFTVMKTPGGEIKQFPDKNISSLQEKGYIKL